jgi:hypothetical protein
MAQVAIGAKGRVELEAGSKVRGEPHLDAIVTNMGAGGTKLEPHARLETLYSKSKVKLDGGARVLGDLFATEAELPAGSVAGTVHVPYAFAPAKVTSFRVEFPSGSAPSVFVPARGTRALSPGRYASSSVSGALRLRSGSYYFESLDVADCGVLELEQTAGPTLIFVRHETKLLGSVRRRHGRGDLGIVQVGEGPAQVAGRFEGALIAPNAALEIGVRRDDHGTDPFWHFWKWPDGDGDHDRDEDRADRDPHGGESTGIRGAFYAKNVKVDAREKVRYVRPNVLGPLLFPTDPQACVELIRLPREPANARSEAEYQRDVTRFCSMLGSDECTVQLTSRVNLDYTMFAASLVTERLTPAQYLQRVRDRTRKLRAAEDDAKLRRALCAGGDADGDLIPDARDRCPSTPDFTATDDSGCTDTTLPQAPSPGDVKRVFENSGFMFNAACSGTTVLPKIPAGAFYRPAETERGTYILSGRVMNQPTGCPVWYQFDIEELDAAGAITSGYQVAFMDREASGALVGFPDPVPGGFIQFNPLPTDAGTRGRLGSVGGKANVRFRVRALNGGGMRSDWSEWKLTTNADCNALGFSCG